MKLGIMQPYFFPYLGYFALIYHTERWIIFDTAQFIRHGWIERNRILKPQEGWQYFSVPLERHSRETLIKDIRIRNHEDWKGKIFRQLEHYKKKSPYYPEVKDLIDKVFKKDYNSIVDLNKECLFETCKYLGIDFNFSVFSEMNMKLRTISEPDEWALEISRALGAKEYINPPGGIAFFNREKYEKSCIKLTFLKTNLKLYDQNRTSFESGLSIVDVMMFNSPREIIKMLNNVEFIIK